MLKKLVPAMQVDSIHDIPLAQLWDKGVRGIIADLDNTLVGAKEPLATPDVVQWLEQVRQKGFQLVIVSNNNKIRVSQFADPIVVPFIHSARKPSSKAFRKAMDIMQLAPEQTAVVGDQLLTDVLGGNRLGLFTVLVQPISPKDEGMFTKLNRKIERLVRRLQRG